MRFVLFQSNEFDGVLRVIVLLTDFGASEYVGIMKGVIHSLSPDAQIVDLTHNIPPQSVREGAWVLLKSYKHFPKDSIFVCVVDPGVGSTRDGIVVQTTNYTFIGPDNGLMYPAVRDDVVTNVSSIIIPADSSNTFHGRDVFARMAGYLLRDQAGMMLGGFKKRLGVTLGFSLNGRKGEVVRIDHFGNIITNIPPLDKDRYQLITDDIRWELQWYPTYSFGPDTGIFLVTSSYGTVEITAKNSPATDELHLSIGESISLE